MSILLGVRFGRVSWAIASVGRNDWGSDGGWVVETKRLSISVAVPHLHAHSLLPMTLVCDPPDFLS